MENGSGGTKPWTNTNEKEICSVIQTVQFRILSRTILTAAGTTPGSNMDSAESTYNLTKVFSLIIQTMLRILAQNLAITPRIPRVPHCFTMNLATIKCKHQKSIIVHRGRLPQIANSNQPLVAASSQRQNPKPRVALIKRIEPKPSNGIPSMAEPAMEFKLDTTTRWPSPVRVIRKASRKVRLTLALVSYRERPLDRRQPTPIMAMIVIGKVDSVVAMPMARPKMMECVHYLGLDVTRYWSSWGLFPICVTTVNGTLVIWGWFFFLARMLLLLSSVDKCIFSM